MKNLNHQDNFNTDYYDYDTTPERKSVKMDIHFKKTKIGGSLDLFFKFKTKNIRV